MLGIGKVLGFQSKMAKHLDNKDHDRVKDYLIVAASTWPNLSECPIDENLLKAAKQFLADAGWSFSVDPKRGLVITDPTGGDYSSHKDGVPKYPLS